MRRIQSRLKKLNRLFPAKPSATPEEHIRGMALQQVSSEDLMVLRRLILSRQAGRRCDPVETRNGISTQEQNRTT